MALRAAEDDESRGEQCGMLSTAWAVEVGSALDRLKPSGSLARNTLESQ